MLLAVEVMLLSAEVMLLSAEVMLLHVEAKLCLRQCLKDVFEEVIDML